MEKATDRGNTVKWVALFTLVIQNSALVLFMRYSRILLSSTELYSTSTAVVCAECLKFVVSIILSLIFDVNGSIVDFISLIRSEFIEKWKEVLLLSIPSGLYVLQNNLQYIASSNLPADVFQVLSNLKIVTTALLSVLMLGRTLSTQQWMAVIALTCGVGIVQISFARKTDETHAANLNAVYGFICVLGMVSISGFAGVFFEKVLKSTAASIWVRNIQLAMIGIIISAIGCHVNDGEQISKNGFFYGYNWTVYFTIILAALGGLVVAVVVKYADNVIKGFATAMALVISSFVSVTIMNDSEFNMTFVFGSSVVVGASILYSQKSTTKVYSPLPPHDNNNNNATTANKSTYIHELPMRSTSLKD
jgi:solute carrier family 35 (UDP-sugar transporter), member A1/2/3